MSSRVVSLDRKQAPSSSPDGTDNDWDLVDEISRLKIGQVAVDPSENLAPQTPPKSKLPGGLSEASPLETSSEASADSSSENHHIAHSRGSSTDTTVSSTHESTDSHTLLAPAGSNNNAELKERPHSFSGGLSTADLRRLQLAGNGEEQEAPETPAGTQVPNQQWSNNPQYNGGDQPTYPSLATRAGAPTYGGQRRSDDMRVEYNIQQRNFIPLSQPTPMPAQAQFIPGRPGPPPSGPNMSYRQAPRNFPQPQPQPNMLPPAAGQGYPHHAAHVSLGNTQHMYDMMQQQQQQQQVHESHHPAVTRVQHQHNVFRHQHSASDPSTIRDAAALALLNSNMQAYAAAQGQMFGQGMGGMAPMQMYPGPNPFYAAAAQEQYSRAELIAAQAMANRIQPQYSGSYGASANASIRPDGSLASPMSIDSQNSNNGPSANNRKLGLYKTELCRSWEEKGTCRYGTKCQFAHGEDELRKVSRHPKYKTEICRTFWVSGSCPYGKRCCFIHTELPVAGGVLSENTTPPPHADGRSRSMSINSDPDASVSLLARISAQRNQDAVNASNNGTPVDMSPPSAGSYHFNSRPPTGSLRVDTSVDNSSAKQNKSAYPSFAGKGVVSNPSEQNTIKSPVPVTAGPDLGRHNNSRVEIVGYNNQQRLNRTNNTNNPNVRHSFSGPDDLNFTLPAAQTQQQFSANEGGNSSNAAPRGGHVRSGSAGDWGSFGRGTSHLAAPSPYPNATSPETKGNPSPWASAVGTRLHETAWA